MIPTTTEELYTAINKLAGHVPTVISNKAFETYMGDIHIHKHYRIGTYNKTEKDLVEYMWKEIQAIIGDTKPIIIWRRIPTIIKDDTTPLTILSMRLSITPCKTSELEYKEETYLRIIEEEQEEEYE